MSDVDPRGAELAIAELRWLTDCHCNEAWTGRGLHGPDCNAEYRADLDALLLHYDEQTNTIADVRRLAESSAELAPADDWGDAS